MDVRVFPPLPQQTLAAAAERARLGQLAYHEPALANHKLDGDSMFLGMSPTGLDFPSPNQFRVPQPPLPPGKLTPPTPAAPWRRDNSQANRLPWPFSLGDEDFHIPPITPPTPPDHAPGSYHPLAPQHHHPFLHPASTPHAQPEGGPYGPESSGPISSTLSVMQQMVNSDSRFTSGQQPMDAALGPRSHSGLSQQGQLTTINQSQLGLAAHHSPSPPGSQSATPSPCSSLHEEESEDLLRRPAAFDPPKKAKTPKKKKRKDPNEPVKPVSAYALFFRDTQASIKAQNPNATFGEVSKIVASMWDGLGDPQKQVYKKRTETAKKEYLKQLAAYRASLVSQSYEPSEMRTPLSSSSPGPAPPPAMFTSKPTIYAGHPGQQQHHSHPGNLGQQQHSHPGHPGQQQHSQLSHPGQQQHSHPGHPGQLLSHPGNPGQQQPSHPCNPGQQQISHPSHPGQQQHPSHPSNPGQQRHPSHPGNQGQHHPGHQGQQRQPSHPGNQGQHHSGNQGQQHPSTHHSGMYPPYPHTHGAPPPSHSPGLSPHPPMPSQLHPQLQALSSRGAAPRPNVPQQGALSVGSAAAASPPPPHHLSPPLHSQAAHLGGLHSPHHHGHQQHHQHHNHLQNLHQNLHPNLHHSPHHNHMQQQLAAHPLGQTHPASTGTQGYPLSLQSDYQPMGGGMLSSRVMMSSPVDYHPLGRPHALDWASEYHGPG